MQNGVNRICPYSSEITEATEKMRDIIIIHKGYVDYCQEPVLVVLTWHLDAFWISILKSEAAGVRWNMRRLSGHSGDLRLCFLYRSFP